MKKTESEIEAYSKEQKEGNKPIDTVVLMSKCTDHCFHLECLEMQMGQGDHLKCAICSVTYGVRTGDMPKGKMTWKKESFCCDGYAGINTWVVKYSFNGGKHPVTGKSYNGDGRWCYLPDTAEGRQVLALLVKCFRRKLTFTVGFSVVRGRDNCIVWNGIHHKTNTSGGSSHYGYPDTTYFNRVT